MQSDGSSRLSLFFSYLGHTYVHLFTAFYFTIVLALEVDWQLPYHELLELWTLGALLVGLAAIPAGWLGDRWPAAAMMVVYFIGMGAAGVSCGLVETPLALMLGLASVGLFAAIYHPVGTAWLVRNATQPGKVLGINGIFGSVGVASAALVAGSLIDLWSWRAAFIVPGALSLVTGVALLICLRLGWVTEGESRETTKPRASGRGEMLRVFGLLAVTIAIMGITFQATQTAMPKLFDLRLSELAGEGVFGVGALVATVYFAGGIMQIVGGYLADRIPLKLLYVVTFTLQAPVLIGITLFSGLPLIAVAMLTVVLAAGARPAENMLLARYTPARHHSLAYGVKFVLTFGSAPLAIGMVSLIQERTGEFEWLFGSLAAMTCIAVLAALLLPGERQRAGQTVIQPAEEAVFQSSLTSK